MASSSDGARAVNITLWAIWLGEERVNHPKALGCVWHVAASGDIQPKLYEDNPSAGYLFSVGSYIKLRININTESGDVSICEES